MTKALLEVVLVPRIQLNSKLVLFRNCAEPIPLQLEQPAFAVERIAHSRHHRDDHLVVRGLGYWEPV
jgi:hypothetical protein